MDKLKKSEEHELGTLRYRFGAFEFDSAAMELRCDDSIVELDAMPQAVLNMLLENAGDVVTKEEFFDEVWANRIVEDSSLTVAISKIRKALSTQGSDYIRTVHRVGYQLTVPVEREIVRRPSIRLKLSTGEKIPHARDWTLIEPLRQEGASEHWLAKDSSENRRVFKFATEAGALRALKRELTAFRVIAANIPGAPGIPTVLDSQFAKSPFYISIPPYGTALNRCHELSRDERLRVVAKAARILAMAHSVGILHLDMKPKNIVVDLLDPADDPDVQLIDFANARLESPDQAIQMGMTLSSQITADHDFGSTPIFLAPEVLAGNAGTTQSDIYSLGVILYQAWLGDFARPFASGWEADIDDPIMQKDIRDATAGLAPSRLTSAEELADRLDTLQLRRDQYKQEDLDTSPSVSLRTSGQSANVRPTTRIAAALCLSGGFLFASHFYVLSQAATQRAHDLAEKALLIEQHADAATAFLVAKLLGKTTSSYGNGARALRVQTAEETADSLGAALPQSPAFQQKIFHLLALSLTDLNAPENAYSMFKRGLALNGGNPTQEFRMRLDFMRSSSFFSKEDAAGNLQALENLVKTGTVKATVRELAELRKAKNLTITRQPQE